MQRKLIITVGATVSILFGSAVPASAASEGLTGTLRQHGWVHYEKVRTINVGGTNIYVKKTDGPELDLVWRKCDHTARGVPVRFPNADPTRRIRIGSNFRAGTKFCLSAFSRGNNVVDTWKGTIDWNVRS